jgi:DNA-directed RNA polymerase specialized sigma24 family protein
VSPRPTDSTDGGEASLVQRGRGPGSGEDLDALPASWLVDFEGTKSADEVDRLVEDQRLFQVLSSQNFGGPGWERFQDALARYGLQVLLSWIHKGLIFKRCRERGIPTKKPVLIDAAEVEQLAFSTVAEAIHAFRERVLRRHQWKAEGGASLRTYFIGQCLFQFPRVYARWLREEQEWAALERPKQFAELDKAPGPAEQAETRILLTAAFAAEGTRKLARVLHLIDAGYGQEEVAEQLGITVGAIESLLYRHRRREGA